MNKIGIFYGSTLGNCKSIALKIQGEFGFGQAELVNIESADTAVFAKYTNLIFGTSTWGLGEMQEDWENFAHQLENIDFAGKKVALFGVGDQKTWGDSFVNGMGILHHKLANRANIVGYTSVADYTFDISLAVKDNQFVGLAIDDATQSDLSGSRISQWVAQLKKQFI